jgi:hypothetical protein
VHVKAPPFFLNDNPNVNEVNELRVKFVSYQVSPHMVDDPDLDQMIDSPIVKFQIMNALGEDIKIDIANQVNTQAVGTLTINAPTGTIVDGQKLIIRLQSTNIQTFSWNAAFVGSNDLILPTASSGSSLIDYMGFVYNSNAGKWQLLAKVFGF